MARPTLLLLFGASGSGKTSFLELLGELLPNEFNVGRKATTRARRHADADDMRVGITQIDRAYYDLRYNLYGHDYGISSQEIEDSLTSGKHYGLVVQDLPSLRVLQKKFARQTITAFIFRSMTKSQFLNIGKLRGTPEDELEVRWSHYTRCLELYYANIDMFDAVVLNAGTQVDLSCVASKWASCLMAR